MNYTLATSFTERGYMDQAAIHVIHVLDTRSIGARMHSKNIRCCRDWENTEFLVGKICYFMVNSWRLRFEGPSLRFWQKTYLFVMLTRVFFVAKPQLESIKS